MARQSLDNIVDEARSPTKTIILLAWPVLVEQIFTTLVGYADTAMVGSMGASATAAVSISQSPIMLLHGIVMALGVGITTLVARAAGAGDKRRVQELMRHAILAILYIGVPIALVVLALHRLIPKWMGAEPDVLELAAQYNLITGFGRIFMITSMMLNSAFRGYGDTKTPLRVNTTMNVVNIIFNFLLIYPTRELSVFGVEFTMWGAGWGVAGAAVATAIGMATAGLQVLWIAFFRRNGYEIDIHGSWKLDRPMVKQIFTISFPAMLERMFMSTSGILITSSVAILGTVAVAARTLCDAAESLSFMPAFAFQTAATTLVGQSLGANKPDLATKFVHRTMALAAVLMVFANIGLFVFSEQLIGVFTPDLEVIALASQCLRVVSFMQVPQALGWVLSGGLRGAGDTKVTFIITASTNWGIRALGSVVAIRVLGMGLVQMEFVILAEVIIRMILFAIRFRSGKWKDVIKD